MQFADTLGGEAAQVPSVCPAAVVHVPVQQSALAEQASPGCPQNEDAWQVPFAHRPEQHAELEAQELPIVLHDELRGSHFPLTQF
jgi:hypothetical protein